MDKQYIIDEIKRTATTNGGVPLGRRRFFTETGIKESDWSGRYWLRWGDAVREAGFEPNLLQSARDPDDLLDRLISLPEKVQKVHEIRTDDPVGIEAYWHSRFAAKRKNGEWFALAAADVAAFKRRKFM